MTDQIFNKYKIPNIKNDSILKKIIIHKNISNLNCNISGLGTIHVQLAYFGEQDHAVLLIPPFPHEIPNKKRNEAMHTPSIHVLFQYCLENRINVLRFNFLTTPGYDCKDSISIHKQSEYFHQANYVYDFFYNHLIEERSNNSFQHKDNQRPLKIIPVGFSMGSVFSVEFLLRRPSTLAAFIVFFSVQSYDVNNLYHNKGKMLGIAYLINNDPVENTTMQDVIQTFCEYIKIELYCLSNELAVSFNNYEELLLSFHDFLQKLQIFQNKLEKQNKKRIEDQIMEEKKAENLKNKEESLQLEKDEDELELNI